MRVCILVVVVLALILGCGFGGKSSRVLLEEGDAHYKAGRTGDAIFHYEAAYIGSGNRKSQLLVLIAQYYLDKKDEESARKWILRGITEKVEPTYDSARLNSLYKELKQEHDERATRVAEERARLDKEREERQARDQATRAQEREREAKERHARYKRDNFLTYSMYQDLRTGMSYKEVHSIVGVHGKELSRVDLLDTLTVVLSWQNTNGSNMLLTFQDGKLISKGQFGLK